LNIFWRISNHGAPEFYHEAEGFSEPRLPRMAVQTGSRC
jgi:hypothetical protein